MSDVVNPGYFKKMVCRIVDVIKKDSLDKDPYSIFLFNVAKILSLFKCLCPPFKFNRIVFYLRYFCDNYLLI